MDNFKASDDTRKENPSDLTGTADSSSNNSSPPNNNMTEQPLELRQANGDKKEEEEHAGTDANGASQTTAGTNKTRRGTKLRRSSLELRRMPVNVLLKPDSELFDEEISLDDEASHKAEANSQKLNLLQQTCLNSKFTLRSQMMLSFGVISASTILLVAVVCVAVSVMSGEVVKDKTRETFDKKAMTLEATTTRYIAEDLTPRLLLEDVIDILYETTKDRFYGFPLAADDSKVPFFDTLSKSNKYPIVGKPLPLDWQIDPNVNPDNQAEHVQERLHLYGQDAQISTANAAYFMQGMCDPTAPRGSNTYLEGCTNANNNITTGGVQAPSPTNAQIHRKASDLTPILKSLYEYHQDLKQVGVFFSNSGAGSIITYPATQLDSASSYQSIGCDWLKGPHPLNSSIPILKQSEIARCTNQGKRQAGANIPARLYSPLDREWCKDQVLNPGQVQIVGPYLDAWVPNVWLITVGKAIFDPVTQELVACTSVDVDVRQGLSSILRNSHVTDNSHVSLVRWVPEGPIVVSTAWNMNNATESVTISDLEVGVTDQNYQEFYNLVDFGHVWNATETQQRYEDFVEVEGGYHVRAYPIPPIPDEYDKDYQPAFMVVFSVSEEDLYKFADRVDEQVDDRVKELTILSVVVGLAGLAAVLVALVVVSNYITRPLRKMDETAMRIIDSFGEQSKIVVEDSTKEAKKDLIRTELSDIVYEFQRMVRKFSGGAMARSAKGARTTEVDNTFQLVDEFQELYSSRRNPSFKYKFEESNPAEESSEVGRQHLGPNVPSRRNSGKSSVSSVHNSTRPEAILKGDRQSAYSSPLFRWIVVLIVFPLLLSTITISAAVIATVSRELPDMIHDAESGLIDLQVDALRAFAGLRAGFIQRNTEHSIRDLHLQTRYISWLLFGGLKTEAYPELLTATEPCKLYDFETKEQCPYVEQHQVCDCAWGDDFPCVDYSMAGNDSRYLQIPYFTGMSDGADLTGDRDETSYPALAYSPQTTSWWRNQFEVPGSPAAKSDGSFLLANGTLPEDEFIQGYGTTYHRLRSAAASPLYVALHNYEDRRSRDDGTFTLVSFEADGMILAYGGCKNMELAVGSLYWHSNEENGAAELRPDICPVGKYGYDARCRGWYDSGRKNYLSEKASLYVTPPYVYASSGTVGQSATAPLFDPETKRHIGQVLVDFVSTRTFESMDEKRTPLAKGGFPLLLASKKDIYGADAVIGPGLSISDPAKPVEQVVKARNESCDDNNCGFDSILQSMRADDDEGGNGTFILEDTDGSSETYHIAYAPVVVKSLKLVDSSDFSRGVELKGYNLYSVGLAEPEASMLASFEQAEDEIWQVIHIGLAMLCTLIIAAAGLVVWLSHRITISMTEPMYYLLELMRHINQLDVGEDPPDEDLHGGFGSKEVLNVRMTMEKLYRIIQCANAAYFAGETEIAYGVFTDALQLFTRLDNRKAMGVANNNLGNTMLTFYRTMEASEEETLCGMNRRQIIGKGMAYFHQAIQLGEKAYDEFYENQGWSPSCLHFMQHLSNRYFNRAMFLLTVKDGHERPKEIEELGMRDVQIARDMDVEIVDEGTQVGWDVRTAEAQLEVLLCRIRGHVTLLKMGYPDDWEVDEMLDGAVKILTTELKKDSSDLFKDIGPVGRLQQIEILLMRYRMAKEDLENAARIGIRMLVEDEFILPEAQKEAIGVMIKYAESTNVSVDVQKRLKECKDWLQDVDEVDTQAFSNEAFASTRSSTLDQVLSRRKLQGMHTSSSTVSLRQSLRGDITMEAF